MINTQLNKMQLQILKVLTTVNMLSKFIARVQKYLSGFIILISLLDIIYRNHKYRMLRLVEQLPAQTSQENSYNQTQFFFYLLPCYYALVAFSFRYHTIMKDTPQRDVNPLPGQFLITCLQNVPQKVPGLDTRDPPASYVLKSKLCLLNSYLYLFMTLFSLLGTPQVFYACKHRRFAPIYLFGFAAWSFAAIILRREYRRKLNQSLWTHRFFWIFSGAFAITKMFEDYLLPMNLILNCISIASNIVLAIYGVYRAEDNDTLELIHNEDTPNFVIKFFQFIELNSMVRKVFRIKQLENRFMKDQMEQIQNINQEDLKQFESKFKVTAQTRRQQINLLNTLPRRNIFIDKKLKYLKMPNNKIKYFYFMITQIGTKRFQASREIQQFTSLQRALASTFNQKNFPGLILPKLKLSGNQATRGNDAEILEEWLTQILKKPIFIISPILTFLNVDQQNSAPFSTYFEFSYKSFCSKHYILNQILQKKQRQSRRSLVGYYEEERQAVRVNNFIKQKLTFKIAVDPQITQVNSYGFLMACIREDLSKQTLKWKLLKIQQNILQLHQRIEQQCKISIPAYYKMISTLSNQKHSKKADIYCQYIQQLVNNDKYYSPSLFQFIRFDPIAIQVKILGGRIQLSSQNLFSDNRHSHYFQQYDQTDQFIQVLRVDRNEDDEDGSYAIKIKRKNFVVTKNTKQLTKLGNQLTDIYLGVSYVPKITLTNCTKKQVKSKVQNFLSSIESLPQIKKNRYFLSFYQNTI